MTFSKVKGTAEEAISAVFAQQQQNQDIEQLRIEDLEIGRTVYIRTARKPGSIERIDTQKAQCVVRIGQFAMTVPVTDLGPFTIGNGSPSSSQKNKKDSFNPLHRSTLPQRSISNPSIILSICAVATWIQP